MYLPADSVVVRDQNFRTRRFETRFPRYHHTVFRGTNSTSPNARSQVANSQRTTSHFFFVGTPLRQRAIDVSRGSGTNMVPFSGSSLGPTQNTKGKRPRPLSVYPGKRREKR